MNSINSGCVNAARQKCVFRQQKYQLLKAHIFSPQHTSISTDDQAADTVASTLAADMQEDWQSKLWRRFPMPLTFMVTKWFFYEVAGPFISHTLNIYEQNLWIRATATRMTTINIHTDIHAIRVSRVRDSESRSLDCVRHNMATGIGIRPNTRKLHKTNAPLR